MTESKYTTELAEAVLHRVSEGASLSETYRELSLSKSTVRQWARDNRSGFGVAYQQARALQLESWSDRIIDTANRTDIEAADKRVICDNYKWLLSKLRPERYGEPLLVGALDALQSFCDHVLLEHEPPGATMQHDAVPALLDQRQQ
jgi:hypothetical protein